MRWIAEVLAGLVALAGCCAVSGGGSGVFFSVQDLPCEVVVKRVDKALQGVDGAVSPAGPASSARGRSWVVRGGKSEGRWEASVSVECLSGAGSKISVITLDNTPQAAQAVREIAEQLERALAGRGR